MAHSMFRRLFKSNQERAARFVEQRKAAPLDHDKSGKRGGSMPSRIRGLDELRAELEAKGGVVDRRWGEKRLLTEIEAHK